MPDTSHKSDPDTMTGLRHQRGRESDLIYEAYYDAVRSDIEEDADRPPAGQPR